MRTKKIIAVISVIVILSMSLAAFALASTQPTVSGPPAPPVAGAPVSFTITTNNMGLDGTVAASANLVFQNATATMGTPTASGFNVISTTITYNYVVAAGTPANAPFWFEVSNLVGWDADANQVQIANPIIRAEGTVAPPIVVPPPPDPSPSIAPPPPPPAPDTPRPPKVGDEPASSTPIVIGAIAVLVLGIFGYVKLK